MTKGPLTMSHLRAELIASMRGARTGELPVDRAQAVAALAQATVDLLQAELRFRELCAKYREHGWRFGVPVGAMRVLIAENPDDVMRPRRESFAPPALSDDQVAESIEAQQVVEAYDRGHTVASIAETMGLEQARVREILIGGGVEGVV